MCIQKRDEHLLVYFLSFITQWHADDFSWLLPHAVAVAGSVTAVVHNDNMCARISDLHGSITWNRWNTASHRRNSVTRDVPQQYTCLQFAERKRPSRLKMRELAQKSVELGRRKRNAFVSPVLQTLTVIPLVVFDRVMYLFWVASPKWGLFQREKMKASVRKLNLFTCLTFFWFILGWTGFDFKLKCASVECASFRCRPSLSPCPRHGSCSGQVRACCCSKASRKSHTRQELKTLPFLAAVSSLILNSFHPLAPVHGCLSAWRHMWSFDYFFRLI